MAMDALVTALKRGDSSAFEAAYACYRPRLFAFLARMAGRQELAEDLLQETFLRLARHAPRLAEDTELGGWLFAVARNLHRSHHRWHLVDAERLKSLMFRDPAPDPTPFDSVAAQESGRELERALTALPVKYREVLLLVAVEGMTPAQAAQVLGVKPEALRQRLARARAQLADHLNRLDVLPSAKPAEESP